VGNQENMFSLAGGCGTRWRREVIARGVRLMRRHAVQAEPDSVAVGHVSD
jgi:hypothetical protein